MILADRRCVSDSWWLHVQTCKAPSRHTYPSCHLLLQWSTKCCLDVRDAFRGPDQQFYKIKAAKSRLIAESEVIQSTERNKHAGCETRRDGRLIRMWQNPWRSLRQEPAPRSCLLWACAGTMCYCFDQAVPPQCTLLFTARVQNTVGWSS